MILKKLNVDHPDFPAVEKLYESSFPIEERHSTMAQLVEASEQLPGDSSLEVLGIYLDEDPDNFVGFFTTADCGAFSFLLFFATLPEKRSGGIGSKAIKVLVDRCGDKPLVITYESIYQKSDNDEQRQRRHAFYVKNDFYETGWFTEEASIEFIVASSQKEFDVEAFKAVSDAVSASMPDAPAT
jgi:GNAT superfamily N-acetyltransferase